MPLWLAHLVTGSLGAGTQYPLKLSGALLATIPVALLFATLQRYFIRGANEGRSRAEIPNQPKGQPASGTAYREAVTSKLPSGAGAGAASPVRLRWIRISVAAVLALLVGFVVLLLVGWNAAGSPGLGDYLSEFGAAGAPSAGSYRSAVLCVAGAAGLSALAWRLRAPGVAAAGYLAASGAMFVLSAGVPCSSGCPIPIRDGLTTLPNFVHFMVSALAFALAIGAMMAAGSAAGDPRLRHLSSVAARAAVVLYGVLSTLMLLFGHGLANGLIEKALAVLCLTWLAWAAVRLARSAD